MLTNIVMRGGKRYGGNSLQDLRRSVRWRAPAIEMDFLLAKDGRLLSGHNDDTYLAHTGRLISEAPSNESVRNWKGGQGIELEAALQMLPPSTVLYLDLKSTHPAGQRPMALAAAISAIQEADRKHNAVIMTYGIETETMRRAQSHEITILLKSSQALPNGDALAFSLSAQASHYDGVCFPCPPAMAASILQHNPPEFRLIVPVWGKFREQRRTIRELWLAGVREFITGYGRFRLCRAATGLRF